MHIKRNKRLSIFSLCSGYLLFFAFILLIMLGHPTKDIPSAQLPQAPEVVFEDNETQLPLFSVVPLYNGPIQRLPPPTLYVDEPIREDSLAIERRRLDAVGIGSRNKLHYSDNGHHIYPEARVGHADHARIVNNNIDAGILDRRLQEDENSLFIKDIDESFSRDTDNIGLDAGGNKDIDTTLFELAENGASSEALGDVGDFSDDGSGPGRGDLPGLGEGSQVYAYNFPSQGVGAGIGNGSVGAGAGGGAGIGGGIGEAVLQGKAVPTLGGVGASSAMPLEGQPEGAPSTDGVGGLVGGAGAGGAAGLVAGTVTEKLGLGIGRMVKGSAYGTAARGYNYDHLPKDGALHIMIHVDGSGSILDTRKQLDIMKDTLLKDALLPYYNNDETLYNRRVSIVSSSDERSLQFYTQAAKKDNVLAVAFQDEACPVYHLPTFNKKPEHHYLDDLGELKASLNGYGGLYRGIIFQVDRGRTFSKSFKEFVECSWRGEGYLEGANLKKYYKDNNLQHIKNKDGVVFSDEYHTKSEGDPQYYMDLLFKASARVGLNLNIYGAGLSDGLSVEQ